MPKSKAELAAEADIILDEAIESVRRVFRNPDSPATALASAAATAMRIHDKIADDSGSGKQPSEMSYDELQASIATLRSAQKGLA